MSKQPYIEFRKVSKEYGPLTVVDDLDLKINKGEFVSLLGPSGSGKTTLLMMLAGFVTPTSGDVYVDGTRVNDIPPYKRNLGVVFQNYALFPHLSVAKNIAFPLKRRGFGKAKIKERVSKVLDMVQLPDQADRLPSQLSGGQQQRVALARTLVFEPNVILMDEPLGALDKNLREQMQFDIRRLHKDLGLTIVFVTHDQSEALTMSDRIAVFNHGKIAQIGSPEDIYDRPKLRFVAEFVGKTNLLDVKYNEGHAENSFVTTKTGKKLHVTCPLELYPETKVMLSLRPEHIEVSDKPDELENPMAARIKDIVYQGDHLRADLEVDGFSLVAQFGRNLTPHAAGDQVYIGFRPQHARVVLP
jgi:putative spermidine/putrescine transport system ATP-binding protein